MEEEVVLVGESEDWDEASKGKIPSKKEED